MLGHVAKEAARWLSPFIVGANATSDKVGSACVYPCMCMCMCMCMCILNL